MRQHCAEVVLLGMRLIALYIFSVFSNALSLLIAAHFVPGFIVPLSIEKLFIASAIFALINFFIRPIIKLVLSPVIFITFGLGVILVNAIMLLLLDKLYGEIIIQGTSALLYATLVVSAVNLIIHVSARLSSRN